MSQIKARSFKWCKGCKINPVRILEMGTLLRNFFIYNYIKALHTLGLIQRIKKLTMKTFRFLLTLMISIICMYSCKEEDNQENNLPKTYYNYNEFVKDGLLAYYPFNGNTEDLSGNGLNGTGTYVTYSSDRFDKLDGACYFNGNNSYVHIGNSDSLNGNAYTICFWYRADINDTLEQSILSKTDTAGNGYTVDLNNSGNFSNLGFGFKARSTEKWWAFGGSLYREWISGSERKYEFAAFAFRETSYIDSSELDIIDYFGGEKFHAQSKPANIFNANEYDLYIGRSENTRYKKFKGELDDLLIYNRILTYEEVEQLYKWNIEQ
jgi:hypothetical protein